MRRLRGSPAAELQPDIGLRPRSREAASSNDGERFAPEGDMARYGKAASKSVKSAMRRRKKGSLRSGGSGKRVTIREQAIAIGLSEAREKGAKVPRKSK